jgi:hypothetical protein
MPRGAIEGAVNPALMPLSDATLDVRDPEAPDRIRLAVTLMAELPRIALRSLGMGEAELAEMPAPRLRETVGARAAAVDG